MKRIMPFFMLLVLISTASAAKIHGEIYDSGLSLAENAIVTINTVPEQTIVAKDGSYSFIVPKGEYIIKVKYQEDFVDYSAEQELEIINDGEFVSDIILLPDTSDEEDLTEENVEEVDPFPDENNNTALIVSLTVLVILVVYFSFKKNKPTINLDKDESEEILKFIKEQGGRVTQKDIRKQFPVSEAKISLIITELEAKGKVKKIKRGKGNVIVLSGK